MAAFLTACGPASMKAALDGLDEKKRKKIESMASPCTGASESSSAAPAAAAAAAPSKPAGVLKKTVKPVADSDDAPAKAAAPAASSAPVRKAVPSRPTTASAKPAGGSKPAAAGGGAEKKDDSEGDVISGVPVEQLEEIANGAVAEDVRGKLASANWKERLEAAENIETMCRDGAENMQHPLPEAIVRLLSKAVVDKKETNFQVVAKTFAALQVLAEKAPKLTKRAAWWFIATLVEKLGDLKLRSPASDCLLALAECVTPQFVITQTYDALAKQKSPKVQENGLLWINTLASEFGLKWVLFPMQSKMLLPSASSM
jgi:cytoskeleton-associated protein 5